MNYSKNVLFEDIHFVITKIIELYNSSIRFLLLLRETSVYWFFPTCIKTILSSLCKSEIITYTINISIVELVEPIWKVLKKETNWQIWKKKLFSKIILIVFNFFNNLAYLKPIQSSDSWIPGLSMAFTMILSVLAISFLATEAKVSPDGSLVWPDLGQLYALEDLRNGLGNGYYDLESRSSPNEDWSNAGYQEPTLNDDIFSEASIRDQEYQENSPLWGYQSVSGGSYMIDFKLYLKSER